MNLRYYLRGLGLGIIVTALIMGVALGNKNIATMTDEQIKQRAVELGMIDGNSTLTEVKPPVVESIPDNSDTDVAEAKAEETEEATAETEEATAETEEVTAETEKPVIAGTESESNEDILSQAEAFLNDDPDRKSNNLSTEASSTVTDSEDTTSAKDTTSAENTTSVEDIQPAESSSSGKTTTIVIASGDSSLTVAKKLAAAGIILDASDYDSYLCKNGYDRYINTGSYDIPENASNEDIAKMITGK